MNDFLKGAPREIDRADVLGELLHRFEKDDPNNAVEWVLDTLTELDILSYRKPPLCGATEGATGIDCGLPRLHPLDVDHEGTHDPVTAGHDGIGYRLTVRWPWQEYDRDYAEAESLPDYLDAQREPRVFRSDGPEPPEDVNALEWLDIQKRDQYLYLIRVGSGWLWSRMANRLAPEHRATPNDWCDAVRGSGGRFQEVFPA